MREHLKIKSDFDQLPLDVIVLRPAHPKGIIQISHGMCEHKERYLDFMEYLYHLGYVCLIHDHRGHGQSVLKDEDLGYFYQDGDIGIVEDLHQLTLWIHQQYPDLPLYLFGHSMGSLVVRVYLKKYDKDIQGLIVCGSPSHNKMAGVGIYLAQRYARKKGDHYRPPLIQRIGFESFNKKQPLIAGFAVIQKLLNNIITILYVILFLPLMVLKPCLNLSKRLILKRIGCYKIQLYRFILLLVKMTHVFKMKNSLNKL